MRRSDLGLLVSLLTFFIFVCVDLRAEQLVGLTLTRDLIFFDSATPGTIQQTVPVTGLQSEEELIGIDYRPSDRLLYGIGTTHRLYRIDVSTGVATVIDQFDTRHIGASFGFDFNPTVDRLRVTSNTGQNLRINPFTGQIAAVDAPLAYAIGDPNSGATPD